MNPGSPVPMIGLTLPALRRSLRAALLILLAGMLPSGCVRDNGLPRDLVSHLAASGIVVRPVRTHAPWSERGGFVIVAPAEHLVETIVSTFALESVPADDSRRALLAARFGGIAITGDLWGIAGRPTSFKLVDGAQFEFFYLHVTPSGEIQLFAEYAHG